MRLSGLLILIALGLSQFAAAQDENAIISSQTLIEDFNSVKVIDVSTKADYDSIHIPYSMHVWRPDFTDQNHPIKGMMASQAQIENLLSDLGIEPDDQLILYDHRGGCDAARFWWILNFYGHQKTAILDGGLFDWSEFELNQPEKNEPTAYQFSTNQKSSALVSKNDVLNALDDPNTIIVDTRTLDEYEGNIQKDGASRAGRIPGAVHFDWAAAINYDEDKTFYSKEKLEFDFMAKGIVNDKKIITYCQSGARSAHTTFVLTQILGFEEVQNYDGSWIEWSADEALPIETGPLIDTAFQVVDAKADTEIIEQNETSYADVFLDSFESFANYTWQEITFQTDPWYVNYFWLLVVLSLLIWGLEVAFPWRKDQPRIRKDFWMDAFFMFFNFYIFKLIIFMAFSNWMTVVFEDFIGGDVSKLALLDMSSYALWLQLLIFFVATDFIQWFTHVLLHRFDFLWRFHKVHHSVEQMGFAAHLRYHWMENIFYTPMKYIAVMLIGGFTPEMAYIVFYFSIAIGHLNHANIALDYGPLKYILNNPKMHIWHHAKSLPKNRRYGVNFGITLSIWDYIFRTNYIPSSGRDIPLGFKNLEKYPKKFIGLMLSGFTKTPDED